MALTCIKGKGFNLQLDNWNVNLICFLINLEGKFLAPASIFLLVLIFVLSSHWLLFEILTCYRNKYQDVIVS